MTSGYDAIELYSKIIALTSNIQGFRFLALADGVVHLALDDGVMQLPGNVIEHHLCGIVSDHQVIVEVPAVGQVVRIRFGFATWENYTPFK